MSFGSKHRKLRSRLRKGSSVTAQLLEPRRSFAQWFGDALKRSYGDAPDKVIARKIGRTPRAVRNWRDGLNGCDGETLLALMADNERFLEDVLREVRRFDLADASRRAEIAKKLDAAVAAIKDQVNG